MAMTIGSTAEQIYKKISLQSDFWVRFHCHMTDYTIKTDQYNPFQWCHASFSSSQDLQAHQAEHIGHRPFPFKRLPQELREMIYKYFTVYTPTTTPKQKMYKGSILLLDRQITSEAKFIYFAEKDFMISGKWNLNMMGSVLADSAALSRDERIKQAWAARCKEASLLWGFSGMLFLNEGIAEIVRHWNIKIDPTQYVGETRETNLHTPGELPLNFLMAAKLVRVLNANDSKVRSIFIELAPSSGSTTRTFMPKRVSYRKLVNNSHSGGDFYIKATFRLRHLMLSLLPFESLRGIKSLEFGEKLKDYMQRFGDSDYLEDVKLKAESTTPYRGDVREMLQHVKEYYLSFGPHHDTKNMSRLRIEMDRAYQFHDNEYIDLKFLDRILSGANCRASYCGLIPEILRPLKRRLKSIELRRAEVGPIGPYEMNDQRLWILFCAFQGIEWEYSAEWSHASVLKDFDNSFLKYVWPGKEIKYDHILRKYDTKDPSTVPWSEEVIDIFAIRKSKPDVAKNDDILFDRSFWMRHLLELGEKGISHVYRHAEVFEKILRDMDKHFDRIILHKQVCQRDVDILDDREVDEVPGVDFIPQTKLDFDTVWGLEEANEAFRAVLRGDTQKALEDETMKDAGLTDQQGKKRVRLLMSR